MKKVLKYLLCTAALTICLTVAALSGVSADEQTAVQTLPTAATTAVTTDAVVTTATQPSATTAASETSAVTTVVGTTSTAVSATVTTEETYIITQPPVSENVKIGWNSIDEKWFYYDGSSFVTGVYEIDGEPYLFAANGALKTGWQTVNSIRRYYDYETHSPLWEWVEYFGKKYYVDKESGKLTGMQKINDDTYIFSKAGVLQTGFVIYENYMYYCNENGVVQYGDDKKTPILIGDHYYFISPKGYVMRGWQTLNGLRIFYDYDTGQPVYGWIEYKGNYYYTDKTSGKYTGLKYISSHPYRFKENGVLCTGFQYFQLEGETSYFFEDGRRAVSEIIYTPEGNYYFNSLGYMYTGWREIDKKKYYFAPDDGKMVFGFREIDGHMYYFDKDGAMCTGIVSISGNKYYFNKYGYMETGWKTVSNKKYYFDQKTGIALIGWNKINGRTYYFDKDAVMMTGKYTIGEDTYFFGSDGIMRTGWQTIKNDKYYFGTDGKMYTYRHVIDNLNYLFYSTGVLATTGNQIIVTKALSQLGQEGGRPYWTWWGFNFRIEWCACFVSWCANQCGYTANNRVPEFISCKVGINWFKSHKQWKGKNYIPKSGDYIFFDWEPDGIADHIGIVDYYEDGYVYTVEGNSGDVVRKRIYDIKSENIYGFAAPNF